MQYPSTTIKIHAAAFYFARISRDLHQLTDFFGVTEYAVRKWAKTPQWEKALDVFGYTGDRDFITKPTRDTVQELLGHKSVATTQRYLGVNYATVREAVEKMAFSATKRDINTLSTQTLKTTSDQALFLELAMRGYDLASLRNAQQPVSLIYEARNTTAEARSV